MPDRTRWEERWAEQNTPWDLGGATRALVDWSRDRDLRGSRILVPGCGKGHDAHFLARRGARVVAVDISENALAAARAQHPDSQVTWRLGDVTALEDRATYDHVWEYTCLCALDRDRLPAYIAAIARALVPGGHFFGLTFHTVSDPDDGPPFQIAPEALRALLDPHFTLVAFEEDTARSIKARLGAEIWFVAEKR